MLCLQHRGKGLRVTQQSTESIVRNPAHSKQSDAMMFTEYMFSSLRRIIQLLFK